MTIESDEDDDAAVVVVVAPGGGVLPTSVVWVMARRSGVLVVIDQSDEVVIRATPRAGRDARGVERLPPARARLVRRRRVG